MAGEPLILTRRERVQNELKNWFGKYADQLEIAATGNLTYNMASLVQSGAGTFINLNLNCKYDGTRFIPLFPSLVSGTVLVWKKSQPYSAAVTAFLEYAKKYLSDISEDAV